MQYYTDKEMADMARRIEEKYGWIVEYKFDYEEQNGMNTLYHYNVYVSGDDYVDHSVDAFERMGAYYVYVDYIETGVAHLQVTLT
jgi:ribulose 1,5-bisphosphate carboxylase large subunit-like protein